MKKPTKGQMVVGRQRIVQWWLRGGLMGRLPELLEVPVTRRDV